MAVEINIVFNLTVIITAMTTITLLLLEKKNLKNS